MTTKAFTIATTVLAVCLAACSGAAPEEEIGDTHDELRVVSSFTSRGTAYYPSNSTLEGGFKDRLGKPLRTLQSYLNGNASYVSVAMDSTAFKYGTRLRIKELEAKYGRSIVFRVVDTGGAFRGKGRSRMDICVQNYSASLDKTINGTLHVEVLDEKSAPASDDQEPATRGGDDDDAPSSTSTGGSGSTSGGSSTGSTPAGSGRACTSDGACNPGNDGSGLICSGGRCVPGCRSNAQCPGTTTCQSGQCR